MSPPRQDSDKGAAGPQFPLLLAPHPLVTHLKVLLAPPVTANCVFTTRGVWQGSKVTVATAPGETCPREHWNWVQAVPACLQTGFR